MSVGKDVWKRELSYTGERELVQPLWKTVCRFLKKKKKKKEKKKYRTTTAATTAAKLLQSCPTLCNPRDGSPSGSAVPGILQARTLEWVAISFSNA